VGVKLFRAVAEERQRKAELAEEPVLNPRTLKKKCKRAVAILIAQHGYKATNFTSSDGTETVYAPARMERGREHPDYLMPLAGTPLLWVRVSYECDDWEPKLPSEFLAEIEFWEKNPPTEADWAA
jgi:hypothetical protein